MIHQDRFAEARQQKRSVFAAGWDRFLQSKAICLSLILLSLAQAAFCLFAWEFLYQTAVDIGILGKVHPVWCYFAIAGVLFLVCAPGCVNVVALWNVRKQSLWGSVQTPDLTGIKLLKLSNTAICIVGGAALAVYPTVIITAGDYLSQSQVTHIFYLFLTMTLLFLVCITLVRVVLRCAEENISCGWANTRFLLPLIAVCILSALVIGLLTGGKLLFYFAAMGVCLAYGFVLILYWIALHRINAQQELIDRQAISDKKAPYDDPYNRY